MHRLITLFLTTNKENNLISVQFGLTRMAHFEKKIHGNSHVRFFFSLNFPDGRNTIRELFVPQMFAALSEGKKIPLETGKEPQFRYASFEVKAV